MSQRPKSTTKKVGFFDDDDEFGDEDIEGGKKKKGISNSKVKPKKDDLVKENLNIGASLLGLECGKSKQEAVFPYSVGLERLDENFNELDAPWIPPNVDFAIENALKKQYRLGQGKILTTNVLDEEDIDLGTTLHFFFLKSTAVCLFVMSILCVPSIAFSAAGKRITADMRDPLGMYAYTVGNMGYDSYSPTFYNQSSCTVTSTAGSTYTGTCATALGQKLTSPEIAGLLTLMEFLQIIAFFCYIAHLRRRVFEITAERTAKHPPVRVCDYSIIVRGLPMGTTEEELLEHFHQLYPLDVKDWKGRPPVQDAKPLEHCDNTGNPMYKDKWVAEISLYKSMSAFLRFYRKQQRIMKDIYRSRAYMKMFSEKTPHAYGASSRMWEWMEKRMLKGTAKLDRLTEDFVDGQLRVSKNPSLLVRGMHAMGYHYDPAAKKPANKNKPRFAGVFGAKKPNLAQVVPVTTDTAEGAGAGADGSGKKPLLGPDGKPAKTIMVPDPNDPDVMIEIVDPEVLLESMKVSEATQADAVLSRKQVDLVKGLNEEVDKSKTNIVGSAEGANLQDDDDYFKKKFKARKLVFAFVTFEHCESMARCVEDYAAARSLPFGLLYPKTLKLHGKHCIRVEQAPDPETIIWDNLEETSWRKFSMRARTGVAVFLMILVSYAIMVQATEYKRSFKSMVPSVAMCDSDIKMLYNLASSDKISLTYPPTTNNFKQKLDAQCAKVSPGAFYSEFSLDKKFDEPGLGGAGSVYAVAQCKNPNGLCPNFAANATATTLTGVLVQGSSTYCPCISTAEVSSQSCGTKDCFAPPHYAQNPTCKRFNPSLIGMCYCKDRLADSLTGSSSMLDIVQNPADVCYPFIINYVQSIAFNYILIVVAVIINVVIRRVVRVLTAKESHSSFAKMHSALLQKVFVSLFVNLAVTPIVAFGALSSIPDVLKTAYIFAGVYPDMTLEWYAVMGSFLITELLFHLLVAGVAQVWGYAIGRPCTRMCWYNSVQGQTSYFVPTQYELDKMEAGPYFSPAGHSGHWLAVLFFAMTFASGLPLLIPIACLGFAMAFLLDKVMFFRYYRRPHSLTGGGALPTLTLISLLPYAALLRVALACWMLSSRALYVVESAYNEIAAVEVAGMPLPLVYRAYLDLAYATITSMAGPDAGIGFLLERVMLPHVLPLLVLFLVILVVKLLVKAAKLLYSLSPAGCLARCLGPRLRGRKSPLDAEGRLNPYELLLLKDPLRRHSSPYTGDYVHILRTVADHEKPPTQPLCSCIPWPPAVMRRCCPGCRRVERQDMTDIDAADGWRIETGEVLATKSQYWEEITNLGGVTRLQGERRRTYEVIMFARPHTYMLSRLPAFRYLLQSTGDEGHNELLLDAAAKNKERIPTCFAEDIFASVGNGGDAVTDRYLFKKAGRTAKKNDAAWDQPLGTDDARRAKLTDDQKTHEAFDKFWDVGQRPEEDHDDDEWDSEEYSSDSEDGYEYYSDEVGEGDEEKLVDEEKEREYMRPQEVVSY